MFSPFEEKEVFGEASGEVSRSARPFTLIENGAHYTLVCARHEINFSAAFNFFESFNQNHAARLVVPSGANVSHGGRHLLPAGREFSHRK